MLNNVVHAVTMEPCVAIWSSSVEEMVVNIIKMSIQYISCAWASEIENLVLCSYTLSKCYASWCNLYKLI